VLRSLLAISEDMKRRERSELAWLVTRRWQLAEWASMTTESRLKETRLDLKLKYLRRAFAGVGLAVLLRA
jgi:hypothetical protein